MSIKGTVILRIIVVRSWFLDKMVTHLGLRTHELLNEEIGNIIFISLRARRMLRRGSQPLFNQRIIIKIQIIFF